MYKIGNKVMVMKGSSYIDEEAEAEGTGGRVSKLLNNEIGYIKDTKYGEIYTVNLFGENRPSDSIRVHKFSLTKVVGLRGV